MLWKLRVQALTKDVLMTCHAATSTGVLPESHGDVDTA